VIAVVDRTAPADETEWILEQDVHWARYAVERLERQLAKARRRLLNREKELARYRTDGTAPKRAGLQKKLRWLKDRILAGVSRQHRRGPGGEA
jgi:hypothetical protein